MFQLYWTRKLVHLTGAHILKWDSTWELVSSGQQCDSDEDFIKIQHGLQLNGIPIQMVLPP